MTHAIAAAQSALLICDLQNDFIDPHGAYGRAGQSSPEIVALPGRIKPFADALRCLLYTSPSPRDRTRSRMPSSA